MASKGPSLPEIMPEKNALSLHYPPRPESGGEQLELKIPPMLYPPTTNLGQAALIVDAFSSIVSCTPQAPGILGGPEAFGYPLADFTRLDEPQSNTLGDAIGSVLSSQNPIEQTVVKLETNVKKGRRTQYTTLEKCSLGDRSTAEQATLESVQPSSSPQPAATNVDSISWTLDRATRTFDYLDATPSNTSTRISLDKWLTSVAKTDRKKTEAAFSRILSGESRSLNVRYQIASTNGATLSVTTIGKAVGTSADPEATTIFGLHQLEQNNQSVAEELKLFSYLARKVQLSILICDADGKVSWCNSAFSDCTGYRLLDVLGKDASDLLRGPMTESESVQQMRHRMRKGNSFHVEHIQYKKNGAPYWVSTDGNPLVDEAGNVTRFILFQSDLTETKNRRAPSSAARLNSAPFSTILPTPSFYSPLGMASS